MRNYVKNKIKDRLMYCKDWKNSVELYLENKEISSKTDQEFYKSKPFLKIVLDVYYLPYNMCKFYGYLTLIHQYKRMKLKLKFYLKN